MEMKERLLIMYLVVKMVILMRQESFTIMILMLRIYKLVLQTNFINYHTQENVYSGYMNIFSGDSSLWFPQGIATACGLFTCGSNIYATLNRLDYAVHVSSRTIIGYIQILNIYKL